MEFTDRQFTRTGVTCFLLTFMGQEVCKYWMLAYSIWGKWKQPYFSEVKSYKILKIVCVCVCAHAQFFILKNIVQTGSKTLNLNDKCFYGSGKVLVILLCPACLSLSFLNDKTLSPRGSLNLITWINLKKLTESYLLVFVVRFPWELIVSHYVVPQRWSFPRPIYFYFL